MSKKYDLILSLFNELPLNELKDEKLSESESKDMVDSISPDILQRLLKELNRYEEDKSLWTELGSATITTKKLASLLRQLFVHGSQEQKFLSSRLYIQLLFTRLSFFDALLYQRVFQILKSWIVSQDTKGVVTKKKSIKKTRTKSKKKKEDYSDDEELSTGEIDIKTGLEHVKCILSLLVKLFDKFSLKNEEELRLLTVEILCELTRFTYSDESKGSRGSIKTMDSLYENAYCTLQKLTLSIHGPTSRSYSIILKHLLPNILMSFITIKGSAPISRAVKEVHQCALDFVRNVIKDADDNTLLIILSLVQHICVGIPERAEYRGMCENSVATIIEDVPRDCRETFVKFLDQYSRNKKSIYRLAAVEIAEKLILCIASEDAEKNTKSRKKTKNGNSKNSNNRDDDKVDNSDKTLNQQCCTLLTILRDRASDKLVMVRAKALSKISGLLESKEVNNNLDAEINNIFFPKLDVMSPSSSTEVIPNDDLLSILRRRIHDSKCSVRKSALQLMGVICRRVTETGPSVEVLSLLQDRCYDPAVSMRKQAMVTLCELLEHFPNCKNLIETWVLVIPRFILDTEQSVQEKALDYFKSLVLDRLRDYRKNDDDMIWLLVERFEHGADIINAVDKGCSILAKRSPISKSLIDALESAILDSENTPEMSSIKRRGAWIMLSHLAPFALKHLSYQVVVDYWENIRGLPSSEKSLEHLKVLSTLSHVAGLIPDGRKSKLISDLVERLTTFSVDSPCIQAYMQALVKLGDSKKRSVDQWSRLLLDTCTDVLGEIVLPAALEDNDDKNQKNENCKKYLTPNEFDRYLFTVGEVSRIRPKLVPEKLTTIVQTLVASSFTHLILSVPDNEDPTKHKVSKISVPSSTRAHAFIALGKFCLDNQSLAQKCVAAFARELETSKYPVVRNNVMVIMCDLCKRYTSLVDRYVSKLALCLRDESVLVRRQTLMLLTHLIQEDYIKWNTAGSTLLFFRFIVALVDESPAIRQYANCCLISLLEKKSSLGVNIFFNNFIETIFFLNDYVSHTFYNQFKQTEQERALFTLKEGSENRKKRMTIYRIFLSHMQDTQKFNLQSKLVTEILGAVVDNSLSVDKANYIILDTLAILSSVDIKMKILSASKDDDTDGQDEQDNETEKLVTAATGRMLSKIQRKNVIENIIPIVIELKHQLSKHRSPLLRFLMDYLKELMVDYKDEIGDILVTDPQLAREIEYDLRTLKEQQKQFPVPPTPNFHAISRTPKRKSISGQPPELSNLSVPSLRKSTVRRLSLPYHPSPARVNTVSKTGESENFSVPKTPFRVIGNHTPGKISPSKIPISPALQRMRTMDVNLPASPFPEKSFQPKNKVRKLDLFIPSENDSEEEKRRKKNTQKTKKIPSNFVNEKNKPIKRRRY